MILDADSVLADREPTLCVTVRDERDVQYERCLTSDEFSFPATIPVVRDRRSSVDRFVVEASLDSADEALGTVFADVAFEPGSSNEVRLRFDAECSDVRCLEPQTCVEGGCVDGCFEPSTGTARSSSVSCGSDECDCPCAGDVCDERGVCSPALPVTIVAAGWAHTCAATAEGLYCWGSNESGQLGIGTMDPSAVPQLVEAPDLGRVLDIATGVEVTCATTVDEELWCWGASTARNGQPHDFVDGPERYSDPIVRPVRITALEGDGTPRRFTAISAGERHSCVLLSDASVSCVGQNRDYQQLGADSDVMSRGTFAFVPGVGDSGGLVSRVSVGESHTCAIQAGAMRCWGRADRGETGQGDTGMPTAPASSVRDSPLELDAWLEVAAGWRHTCGIAAQGPQRNLLCWGRGDMFRLGTGDEDDRSAPVLVASGAWDRVSAGQNHTCATMEGELHCWGGNESGQLGLGTRTAAISPTRVGDRNDWDQLSLGRGYSCGIRGGALHCWGSNLVDQLGIVGGERTTPTRVCIP